MPCLLHLMDYNEHLLSQKHIALVFDNIDMLVSQHGTENLLKVFNKFYSKKVNDATQLILTARAWCPNLRKIIRHFHIPALVIGNFLEAALYGNLKITLEIKLKSEKINCLIGN